MTGKLIPMPILRKDQEATKLEAIIQRSMARYLTVAPDFRVTLFLNSLIGQAKRSGRFKMSSSASETKCTDWSMTSPRSKPLSPGTGASLSNSGGNSDSAGSAGASSSLPSSSLRPGSSREAGDDPIT